MAAILIANERANWGLGRRVVGQAAEFLRRQGLPLSIRTTEYPGHARELAAAAAAQNLDTVVVSGGDGTVNEVVDGLVSAGAGHTPRLGLIPAGSSDDLSKSLGIPQAVSEACRVILAGRTRALDVGQAQERCFCSASCLGYFAQVAARSLEGKRRRGSLRYVAPALGVIREMAGGWEMTVRADGRVFQGAYAVLLVGNAPRFGGLTMLPGARPDDGMLDCLLIEMVGKWEALQMIPLVYRQALERHRKAIRFQAASVSVTLNRATQVCCDGEMVPGSVVSLDYRLLPRRLPVFC